MMISSRVTNSPSYILPISSLLSNTGNYRYSDGAISYKATIAYNESIDYC